MDNEVKHLQVRIQAEESLTPGLIRVITWNVATGSALVLNNVEPIDAERYQSWHSQLAKRQGWDIIP